MLLGRDVPMNGLRQVLGWTVEILVYLVFASVVYTLALGLWVLLDRVLLLPVGALVALALLTMAVVVYRGLSVARRQPEPAGERARRDTTRTSAASPAA